MRILVCGSRDWTDSAPIHRELLSILDKPLSNGEVKHTLIHGAARGADTLAGMLGHQLGFFVRVYPARWDIHGKSAGPIRNRLMLMDGKPDMILAFTTHYDTSRGTKNMCEQARGANLPVFVFDS